MSPLWFGRILVFLAALLPPCLWLYQAQAGELGPDPGKAILVRLGEGAWILLLLTLSLTPLQRLTPWRLWGRIRRQLGLWSFTYASLHLLAYVLFILGLAWERLPTELAKHPYILVGAMAWLLLTPLALTSNTFSMARLGKYWKFLHRLIYPVVGLVLLHMLWIVRSDWGTWFIYAGIAVTLLSLRLPGVLSRLSRF